MILEQLLSDDLGCASYVVGCETTRQAAVVDPALDTRPLDEVLRRRGLRLVAVVETHTHADHVSGHGVLALERGVPVRIHPAAAVAYPHEPLDDGDRVQIGRVELVALHTPGHRPEHCALAVVDHERADEPWLVLTGDSLFVGDVARPDLAVAGAEGAAALRRSLHERLLPLGDGVEVFPGHVAGSLCGRAMSARSSTTIGFERRFNPMLRSMDEQAFVAEANSDLAPKPPNMGRIVELNRGPFLARPRGAARVPAVPAGATVLDVRDARAFVADHLPGALHAPADAAGFGTRAAWLLEPAEPLVLVAEDAGQADRAVHRLQAVGFLDASAWTDPGTAGGGERLPVHALDAVTGGGRALQVVDVREPDELPAALPSAHRLPLRTLSAEALDDLDPARATAVICNSGARAVIGAAVLRRRGFRDVGAVLDGGMADLRDDGR